MRKQQYVCRYVWLGKNTVHDYNEQAKVKLKLATVTFFGEVKVHCDNILRSEVVRKPQIANENYCTFK